MQEDSHVETKVPAVRFVQTGPARRADKAKPARWAGSLGWAHGVPRTSVSKIARKESTTMSEFVQTYGVWILVGGFFLLMMRMHSGGGCGMGGHDHETQKDKDTKEGTQETTSGTTRRGGGCH